MANAFYTWLFINQWIKMGVIFQMSFVILIISIIFFASLSIISIKLITAEEVLSKILLVIYFMVRSYHNCRTG